MYEAALLRVRVDKLADLLRRARSQLILSRPWPDLRDAEAHERSHLLAQIDRALAALPDPDADADDPDDD